MDFKVAGTQRGVTGIQLDLKNQGITEQIVRETLDQAHEARLEILRAMLRSIKRPREEISANAPRLIQIQINPEKIGLVIGPGGKTIRRLQEETGAKIDIEDSGIVTLSSLDAAGRRGRPRQDPGDDRRASRSAGSTRAASPRSRTSAPSSRSSPARTAWSTSASCPTATSAA